MMGVASGSCLTLSSFRHTYASLRYRHISNYRLDRTNASIRASDLDAAVTKSLRPSIDLNVDIDNVTNKFYYETQNYFKSRVSPTASPAKRIHATPGYPFGVTVGLTFHLGGK